MRPVSRPERYLPLDILRGMALAGVLLVNLLTLFRVSLFAHLNGSDAPGDGMGRVILALMSILVEFKAFTLFSFLFGVGIAVQGERVSRRTRVEAFLFRRFLVLLCIGLIHLVLIWNGDILTLYAVCGILFIPALRLPTPWIAVAGVSLIIGTHFIGLPVRIPGTEALLQQAAEATRVYAGGGFGEILGFRWRETKDFIIPLLLLTLPRTYGVMLLGVAAWRSGLLTERRSSWLPILVVSAVTGVAGTVFHLDVAAHIPLAFAYAAGVLLWIPRAPLLAAGGQMALTNYLTQSVVFGLVFYGYGLGQFGRLGVVPSAAVGIALYAAQLVFSRWWLRRYHFGPVEWLWRSLTYGQKQPMLRG